MSTIAAGASAIANPYRYRKNATAAQTMSHRLQTKAQARALRFAQANG